jgi:hypothetical protein
MTPKILIVGVDHSFQCGIGPQSEVFKKFLTSLCSKHKIRLIAEEMTLQGIKDRGAATTIAFDLAQGIPNIIHKFIEMDDECRAKTHLDRSSLGKIAPIFNQNPHRKTDITDKLEKLILFPARECCWLATILYENRWPTLLICGEAHLSGIKRLICRVNKRSFVCALSPSEYMTNISEM